MTNPKEVLEKFDKKVRELKDQSPAHLRESEPVEFGYTVDRDDEIFRVVDFGNIKQFIISSQIATLTSQLEAIPEDEDVELSASGTSHKFAILGRNEERQRQRQSLQDLIKEWSELK